MLHQYVKSVAAKVTDSKKLFQVAMIDVERAPLVDAKYSPINVPEIRFF
jgi:hypothetical protein